MRRTLPHVRVLRRHGATLRRTGRHPGQPARLSDLILALSSFTLLGGLALMVAASLAG